MKLNLIFTALVFFIVISASFGMQNTKENNPPFQIGRKTYDAVVVPYGKIYYMEGKKINRDYKFYPLIATPIAIFYEGKEKHVSPLLVENKSSPSDAVKNFLDKYEPKNVFEVEEKDAHNLSIEVAKEVWKKSDEILVLPHNNEGYELGLMAVPIASYMNIPVIIGNAENAIKELECKNAILIGNATAVNISFIRLQNRTAINDYLIDLCKNLGGVDYIAMANPLDVMPVIIKSPETVIGTKGIIPSKFQGYTNPVECNFSLKNGSYIIKCEADFHPYRYSKITKIAMDGIHIGFYGPEGKKSIKPDEGSLFYTDSAAYDYGKAYFEVDVNNLPGEYTVALWGYGYLPKIYNLKIIIEEIEKPGRPQSPFISSLAPYLASARNGIVIADSKFGMALNDIWGITYREQSHPAGQYSYIDHNEIYEKAAKSANETNAYAKKILLETLSQMDEKGCLDKYLEKTPYLGIIADNNMLPMHYYKAKMRYWYELNGQPSDNEIADINNDTMPDLAVGRVIGWDAQDVSALIARTLFYNEIVNKQWKSNAYLAQGGEPILEQLTDDNFNYCENKLREAGFNVNRLEDKDASPYIAEYLHHYVSNSNIILSLAHGRYYRYEYASQLGTPLRMATQFAVCNVKDMKLNPSTMFVDSCIGGLTDGYPLRLSIVAAFLHSGFNDIFAPTRCPNLGYNDPYATTIMKLWVDELLKNNSIGIACRNAKNEYIESHPNDYYAWEDFVHYTIYGDPAFKPYP